MTEDQETVQETVGDEEIQSVELTTDSDEGSPADAAGPGLVGRVLSWCGQRRLAVTLAVLLLASVIAAGSVYWFLYRPDRLTDVAHQAQVAEAAKEGTVALLSYAPDTIDQDLANAKSHLTGPFLTYYSDFTDKIVNPAAKQKGVKTEATVVRSAVSEMHPNKAVVLVFVNQVSTSKERPEPALATSSVMVTMVRSGDRWLISEFNPV